MITGLHNQKTKCEVLQNTVQTTTQVLLNLTSLQAASLEVCPVALILKGKAWQLVLAKYLHILNRAPAIQTSTYPCPESVKITARETRYKSLMMVEHILGFII